MNIKLIFLFFTLITLSNAQDKVMSQEKESKFLEITVDNPELQIEIDNLKKQYDANLNELKAKYDHIIVDTPPTQAVSDALVIAQSVDSVVYVVKSDITRIKPITAGLERLFEVKAHVAGVLLNQVDMSKSKDEHSQGYYDYYDYSQQPEKPQA